MEGGVLYKGPAEQTTWDYDAEYSIPVIPSLFIGWPKWQSVACQMICPGGRCQSGYLVPFQYRKLFCFYLTLLFNYEKKHLVWNIFICMCSFNSLKIHVCTPRRISTIKSQYEPQPFTNRLYQLSCDNPVICGLGFSKIICVNTGSCWARKVDHVCITRGLFVLCIFIICSGTSMELLEI